jgi:hypothetical protein
LHEDSTVAKTPKPKAERRKSPRTDASTTAQANDTQKIQTTATIETPAAAAPVSISRDEIERRAFEFYCARGGTHGHALEDWLQAERELTGSAK